MWYEVLTMLLFVSQNVVTQYLEMKLLDLLQEDVEFLFIEQIVLIC